MYQLALGYKSKSSFSTTFHVNIIELSWHSFMIFGSLQPFPRARSIVLMCLNVRGINVVSNSRNKMTVKYLERKHSTLEKTHVWTQGKTVSKHAVEMTINNSRDGDRSP